MTLNASTTGIFHTFYEKAQELENSRFCQCLSGSRVRLSWTRNGLSTDGPSHDDVKAFGVTLRLFMLSRDRISFAEIATLADTDPGLPDTWCAEAAAIRDTLNVYLGTSPVLPILPHGDGRTATNRDVLETWLYGDLTHLHDAKRGRLRRLLETPLVNVNYASDLQDTLLHVLARIFDLAGANSRELVRHGIEPIPMAVPRLP
ncbi:MAG: hypothetical protein R3F16_13735 [Myxococcota bacterium]